MLRSGWGSQAGADYAPSAGLLSRGRRLKLGWQEIAEFLDCLSRQNLQMKEVWTRTAGARFQRWKSPYTIPGAKQARIEAPIKTWHETAGYPSAVRIVLP